MRRRRRSSPHSEALRSGTWKPSSHGARASAPDAADDEEEEVRMGAASWSVALRLPAAST